MVGGNRKEELMDTAIITHTQDTSSYLELLFKSDFVKNYDYLLTKLVINTTS